MIGPPLQKVADHCPVCDEKPRRAWVHFSEVCFDECTSCHTVYKTETSEVAPADLYEEAYHTGKRSRRWAHRVRKAKQQLRVAMSFRRCNSVLDVGCSVGYIIEAGRQLKLTSAGTDVSAFAVQAATDRGLVARVGHLEQLPFNDNEFDLVVMRHVLEHTATPRDALNEVRRVVSRSGLVLIMVPNLRYWKGRFLRKTYRFFRPDDLGRQHLVYYDKASLTRLLERQGFRVLANRKGLVGPEPRGIFSRIFKTLEAAFFWAAESLSLTRELFFVAQVVDSTTEV